jgi:hypothetical protein
MADPVVVSPVQTHTEDEEGRKTAGQRRVNILWEVTQAIIAVSVTFAVIACVVLNIEIPSVLENGFFVIVTTYLVRTNHTKIGGVGSHEIGR